MGNDTLNTLKPNDIAKESLGIWRNSNKKKALDLDLPEEYFQAFVPQAIYEMAENYDNLQLRITTDNRGIMKLMIIEKGVKESLTDKDDWDEWVIQKQRNEEESSEFVVDPIPPESVNRLHAKYYKDILSGEINLNDKIWMTCELKPEPESKTLYISDYDGVTNKGIGKSFYLDRLPEIAKMLGYRFITGANPKSKLDFFTNTLGRRTYTELTKEAKALLFPIPPDKGHEKEHTIQFLYREDIEKYLLS